jgi:hypothetical protein
MEIGDGSAVRAAGYNLQLSVVKAGEVGDAAAKEIWRSELLMPKFSRSMRSSDQAGQKYFELLAELVRLLNCHFTSPFLSGRFQSLLEQLKCRTLTSPQC